MLRSFGHRKPSSFLLEVLVNLVVVAAGVGLVPVEIYLVVVFDEAQAVGLVPALGEDVETDLTAD